MISTNHIETGPGLKPSSWNEKEIITIQVFQLGGVTPDIPFGIVMMEALRKWALQHQIHIVALSKDRKLHELIGDYSKNLYLLQCPQTHQCNGWVEAFLDKQTQARAYSDWSNWESFTKTLLFPSILIEIKNQDLDEYVARGLAVMDTEHLRIHLTGKSVEDVMKRVTRYKL